jgi:hypothetical protein
MATAKKKNNVTKKNTPAQKNKQKSKSEQKSALRKTTRVEPVRDRRSDFILTNKNWNNTLRAQLEDYLKELSLLMKLTDWDIRIDWARKADNDNLAEIIATYGQKRAVLRLGRKFLRDTAGDQRHTLVHELVHCHISNIMDLVWTTHDQVLTNKQAKMLEPSFELSMETTVDGIADALAPMMPLPYWAKKRQSRYAVK